VLAAAVLLASTAALSWGGAKQVPVAS
jgi:hypothetical protein